MQTCESSSAHRGSVTRLIRRSLRNEDKMARSPHALETSLPGVFAVGDVRSGSAKRVASAVGEGANAVMSVHQVLAE